MNELDDKKGMQVSETRRTICEAVRELYDKSVIGLAVANPELLNELKILMEEIFKLGIKMNRKLIEHNIRAIDFYEVDIIDVAERQRQRQYRANLVRQMEELDKEKGIHGS